MPASVANMDYKVAALARAAADGPLATDGGDGRLWEDAADTHAASAEDAGGVGAPPDGIVDDLVATCCGEWHRWPVGQGPDWGTIATWIAASDGEMLDEVVDAVEARAGVSPGRMAELLGIHLTPAVCERGPVRLGTDFGGMETICHALKQMALAFRHCFSFELEPWIRAHIVANHLVDHVGADVTQRRPEELPAVDLLASGFPC